MAVTTRAPRTVEQAASELNISVHTVRAWVSGRKIGYVRLGRLIRIPVAEIERLLTTGAVPPKRVA